MTSNRRDRNPRLVRVRRDGTTRLLYRGAAAWEAVPSRDGTMVALSRYVHHRTRLRVVSAHTGRTLSVGRFGHIVSVIDFGGQRMILSRNDGGHTATFWWHTRTKRRTLISHLAAYSGDIHADRLALFTKDPYEGGCQRVVRVSHPHRALWTSCRERVDTFSPNGRRMVTVGILSDGPGPRTVRVRGSHGRPLATYRSDYFGFLEWENDRRLLLETAGPHQVAAVRCTLHRCVRASRLHPRHHKNGWQVMHWTFPRAQRT